MATKPDPAEIDIDPNEGAEFDETPSGRQTPQPAKATHNPRSVRLAEEFGISREEMADMEPAVLDEVVYRMSLQRARNNREAARDQDLERSTRPQAPTAPEPEPEADEIDWGEVEEEDGTRRKRTEKDIDPGLANVVKNQQKALRELRQEIGEFKKADIQRRTQNFHDLLDKCFEALGSDYEPLLGKGDRTQIDEASKKRRMAVLASAGLDTSKDNATTISKKIEEAAKLLFPSTPKTDSSYEDALKPANGARRISKEQWDEATLAKPTYREPKEPKGEKKALKNVAKKLAEYGEETGEDELGLPGGD